MLEFIVLWIAAGCLVSPLVYYIDVLGGAMGNHPSNILLGIVIWPLPFIMVLCDVGYYIVQHWKGRY